MSMFLTNEEVVRLTGYQKPSSQSKWLYEQRISHYINSQGRVIVVRKVVEGQPDKTTIAEPRFDNVA